MRLDDTAAPPERVVLVYPTSPSQDNPSERLTLDCRTELMSTGTLSRER